MRRTTVSLPDELHAQLRAEARRARVSLAEVIRHRLERPAVSRKTRRPDPLRKIAGICSGPTLLSEDIDEALYGE